tara:strand:+ start:377 stop:859 length:483 start_codon:yes stop_codon:yes gene_type:complete
MKGFPAHATASPLTETWGEWAKRKASQAKNIVEKGAEIASYIPGPIGSIASGVDAAIDSYDATQAYKRGDMQTYKKEKADAAANLVGIVPGGKLITKGVKGVKALKKADKIIDPITKRVVNKVGQKIVKKGTGKAIEKTVDKDNKKINIVENTNKNSSAA